MPVFTIRKVENHEKEKDLRNRDIYLQMMFSQLTHKEYFILKENVKHQ